MNARTKKSVRKALQLFCIVPMVLVVSSIANAVVIRHDVPATEYIVPDNDFPALVDLPQEGHGVLISSQWIVTAAHNTMWRDVTQVTINDEVRAVDRVIAHSGYRSLPTVPPTGDAAPFMAVMASSDDIALIKLSEPVHDVTPVKMYSKTDEQGKLFKMYGKGATGTGLEGQDANSPRRGSLRRAYNYIASADGKWLAYSFDQGGKGHDLEGTSGSGDSGGPVLIEVDGEWTLAGLTAWQFVDGDISDFQPGHYGQINYQVRISHYAEWIAGVMAANGSVSPNPCDG